MGKRVRRNDQAIAKGDVFTVTTEVDLADVNTDGFKDIAVKFNTLKNGNLFVDGISTWYGMDNTGAAAVAASLAEAGIKNGSTEVVGFSKVVHEWEKLTKALANLNKAGNKHVKDAKLD